MEGKEKSGTDDTKEKYSKRTSDKGGLNEDICIAKKKAKIRAPPDETESCKIWLNNKLVSRPSYPTSHGILFYQKGNATNKCSTSRTGGGQESPNAFGKNTEIRYLLGLIPQGNSWTVFKGLPEKGERPEETAVREFEEETSLSFPYDKNDWKSCPVKSELYGVTSTKKLLHIYMIPATDELVVSNFDVKKVVKIDSGRFSGLPEIIEIRFLTKKQALEGIAGRGKKKAAKIYKSQISILERADAILNSRI